MTGRTLQRSVTFHGTEADAETYRAEVAAEYSARRSVARAAPMLNVGELQTVANDVGRKGSGPRRHVAEQDLLLVRLAADTGARRGELAWPAVRRPTWPSPAHPAGGVFDRDHAAEVGTRSHGDAGHFGRKAVANPRGRLEAALPKR